MRAQRITKLARLYSSIAIIVFNTVVVLLILNLVLWFYFHLGEFKGPTYDLPALTELYPGMRQEDIASLSKETASLRLIWDSYTGFKERAHSGRFVNVSEHGFRYSLRQGPWPPNRDVFTVFVFGGSTTFGYSVSDEQTIASRLQELLQKGLRREVRIYNFGRGQYYSSLERILFEKLAAAQITPQIAIFIDGINEDVDEEVVERAVISSYVGNNFKALIESNLKRLPIYRAAVMLRNEAAKSAGQAASPTGEERWQMTTEKMVARYLHNKRIIEAVAAAFGVHAVFVWQPNPVYKYDLKHHKFSKEGTSLNLLRSYPLYTEMAKRVEGKLMGGNFLWCADLQENVREPLYVDSVHYSPRFSGTVAQCIYDLLPRPDIIDPRKPNP